MPEHKTAAQDLVRGAGFAISHVLALVLGLILMITGLALGVTLVMLPLGIPVGLAGVLVFLWGLAAHADNTPAPPG
jgi:hypothetical protein